MKLRSIVFVLSLIVVGIIITGVAIGQEGQGPEPQSPEVVTASNAFTYQGQLKNGGSLVNGNCDLRFELYNAVTGGSKIGSTLTKTNVDVIDGRFTVSLDFGASAFPGANRWLLIKVRCPAGSGSYTTLTPRQQLTAVPYSLSANTLDGKDSSAFSLTSHNHVGQSWTGSGTTYGLRANTSGTYGLFGSATNTSGTRYGVFGSSSGSTGRGVYGTSPYYGVYGNSSGYIGVYGNGGSGSGDYGGYFTGYNGIYANGENLYGVYGTSSTGGAGHFVSSGNDGLYGQAQAASTTWWGSWLIGNHGYGAYVDTGASGTTYAGYFADNIFVSGNCTGCVTSIVALNGGSTALEIGDLVSASGISDPLSPNSTTPTMMVSKTNDPLAQGVVGVVIGHFTSEIVTKEIQHVETQFIDKVNEATGVTEQVPVEDLWTEQVEVEDVNLLLEAAAPGEYIAFVSSGLAQVNVDASAGSITVGQSLAYSPSSASLTSLQSAALTNAESIIIGTALEPLSGESGLIWVFLGGQ